MTSEYFVIGAGSIGNRHHGNLTALGANSRLMGWRGLNLAALESEMTSCDAPAMVIATATPIRLELIELCARIGAPFYVEKPLAFRRADLDRIYTVAAPVAERSVVGFMMRYHPALLALVANPVAAYGFMMEIGHDVRQWRQNWRFADSYAASAEGGGVLLDLCHELDMAHCLFPAAGIRAVDSIGHIDFPGVDFATRVTLSDFNGPTGTVSMDYLSPKSLRRTAIRGRDTVVDMDFLIPRETRCSGGEDVVTDWTFDRNDMFLGLMGDFMALVEGRAPSDNPLLPRFDRVYDSCALIADAWEGRQFTSQIEGGME